MLHFLEQIDISLFYTINLGSKNVFFDIVMPFVSNVKNFYIVILIGMGFLLVKKSIKTRTVALMIILLIAMSEYVSSNVLKPAFNRPRPYHSISEFHHYNRMKKKWHMTPRLEKKTFGRSHSMPSSHATNMFSAALFLSYYFRKFWPFFYFAAFIVGYSRVYLGVHYPFDVLAGIAAGTLCAAVMVYPTNLILQFLENKLKKT